MSLGPRTLDAVTRPDAAHDAVLACTASHQVVVAPPGTGKTYLAVRLAATIAEGLPPHARVLVLTFSREARSQLEREAQRQLSSETRGRLEITNYHRLAWQAVRAYRRCLQLPDDLDIGSRKRRIKALQAASPAGYAAIKPHSGLPESFAEHAFESFRDQRTPSDQLRNELLAAINGEHRAGRLVFDDLGALFWQLLEQHPSVARAYAARYPAVIADEHQDASALQDAVVRRLGSQRLVVLADPLQLIHEFRGADLERLRAHWRDSDAQHELLTPHRWHGAPEQGTWLLGIRDRVKGAPSSAVARPASVIVNSYPESRGRNGLLGPTRFAVLNLRKLPDHDAIAVLARDNRTVGLLRAYLTRQGLRPRQVGGRTFEEARDDIEQLPLLTDVLTVVGHARKRLDDLVPSIPKAVSEQIGRRLKESGPNFRGAKPEAAALLAEFSVLYERGASGYFQAMAGLLVACNTLGYHLPRRDATHAIRQTAAALAPDDDVSTCVATYNEHVIAATQGIPERTDRGIFVMTAHQAKGKEFDAVVLTELSSQTWPNDPEAQRLFYVAMTRATKSWRLIAPSSSASPLLRLLP